MRYSGVGEHRHAVAVKCARKLQRRNESNWWSSSIQTLSYSPRLINSTATTSPGGTALPRPSQSHWASQPGSPSCNMPWVYQETAGTRASGHELWLVFGPVAGVREDGLSDSGDRRSTRCRERQQRAVEVVPIEVDHGASQGISGRLVTVSRPAMTFSVWRGMAGAGEARLKLGRRSHGVDDH